MKITMKVVLETPDGETTEEVVADARDIRRYESEFDKSFVTSELSMIQMTQLAYVSLKRLKKFTGSYDVFDSQCVEVEAADEEEPVGPTPKAATGGRSSR
jgi:hypothetical protein